jgi:hypothetical protein
MRAGAVIVREVAGQKAAQVPVATDENVIQALTSDRANEALREGVLPRTARCGQDFRDDHALDSMTEHIAIS